LKRLNRRVDARRSRLQHTLCLRLASRRSKGSARGLPAVDLEALREAACRLVLQVKG